VSLTKQGEKCGYCIGEVVPGDGKDEILAGGVVVWSQAQEKGL